MNQLNHLYDLERLKTVEEPVMLACGLRKNYPATQMGLFHQELSKIFHTVYPIDKKAAKVTTAVLSPKGIQFPFIDADYIPDLIDFVAKTASDYDIQINRYFPILKSQLLPVDMNQHEPVLSDKYKKMRAPNFYTLDEELFIQHMLDKALQCPKIIGLPQLEEQLKNSTILFRGLTFTNTPFSIELKYPYKACAFASPNLACASDYAWSNNPIGEFARFELRSFKGYRYGFIHTFTPTDKQQYFSDFGVENNFNPVKERKPNKYYETAVFPFENKPLKLYLDIQDPSQNATYSDEKSEVNKLHLCFEIPTDDKEWNRFINMHKQYESHLYPFLKLRRFNQLNTRNDFIKNTLTLKKALEKQKSR